LDKEYVSTKSTERLQQLHHLLIQTEELKRVSITIKGKNHSFACIFYWPNILYDRSKLLIIPLFGNIINQPFLIKGSATEQKSRSALVR
jgi:hypothetical protein